MISQCPKGTLWDDLKLKLQLVYLMVAMDYHTAMTYGENKDPMSHLQDYIAYWTEMCQLSMKRDPSTTNNKLVIILFVKNIYDKEIHRRVAGA